MTDLEKLAFDVVEAMKVSNQAKVDAQNKSSAKNSAISDSDLANTALSTAATDLRTKADLYFAALEA